jgi:hypothetical protein
MMFKRLLVFKALPEEYLWLVPGVFGVLIHIMEELINLGEELAPPFIPMLMIAIIYIFLPRLWRALFVLVFGGIFAVAQINGHFLPALERGFSAQTGDYSAIFSEIGGILLIILGIKLLRNKRKYS